VYLGVAVMLPSAWAVGPAPLPNEIRTARTEMNTTQTEEKNEPEGSNEGGSVYTSLMPGARMGIPVHSILILFFRWQANVMSPAKCLGPPPHEQ
jgi:hypothetical protein